MSNIVTIYRIRNKDTGEFVTGGGSNNRHGIYVQFNRAHSIAFDLGLIGQRYEIVTLDLVERGVYPLHNIYEE